MGLIIVLMIIGIVLLLVETFLIPGFAITGILGICSIGASCYFGYIEFGWIGALVTILIAAAIIGLMLIVFLKSKTWEKLTLKNKIDAKVDTTATDKGLAVGTVGIAVTRLNPIGRAKFGNVSIEVKSEGEFIDAQQEIVIDYFDDEKVIVKPIKNK